MVTILLMIYAGAKTDLLRPYIRTLTEFRKKNGLTQASLSEAAGYSMKYVTLIESGIRVPSIEALIALSSCAGVPRSTIDNMLEAFMDHFEWED